MRIAAALLLALVALLRPDPSSGRELPALDDLDVDSVAASGEYGVGGSLGGEVGGSVHGGGGGSVPAADSTGGSDNDYYLTLTTGEDGPCIGWSTNPQDSLTLTSAGAVLSLYDVCPAAGAEAVPPSVIARTEVLRFWQSKPVPTMDLEVDPGYAITGLPAYLETGADSSTVAQLTFDTPVGRAVMDVAASYLVDWGDGTPTERHELNGAAWPDGQITHVYQDAEAVTLTARQEWTGTWRVVNGAAAGISGVLPPLPMQAELMLDVDQVQAVVQ